VNDKGDVRAAPVFRDGNRKTGFNYEMIYYPTLLLRELKTQEYGAGL
jgi:hypothetical protein